MRLRISFPLAATAGLLTAIAILVTISYLAWSSLHGIVADLGEAARPDLRLVLAKDIAFALTDAENSVQAYTVSPDSSSLRPYYGALASVDAKLDSLQKVSKTPASIKQNDTLALIVGQKFAVLDSMLGLRKADFMDSALKRIASSLQASAPSSGGSPPSVMGNPTKDKAATPITPSAEPAKNKSGIFKKIFNKKKDGEEKSEQAVAVADKDKASEVTTQPDIKKIQRQLHYVREADQAQTQQFQTRELALMNRSQVLSGKLRAIIAKIENAEAASLIAQTVKAEESAQTANRIIAVFSVTAALLLFFIGFSIFSFAKRTAEQKRVIQYAKEQAEQLAEDRERFVATMSHEIRTPMNAILGFSDQMLQSKLSSEQRQHAEIVKDSTLHLLAVVNSVLDFTQLAAGKLKLAQVSFRLRYETEFIAGLLRQTADKKGIQLQLSMQPDVPDIIVGDPLRYRQILLNLLNNAIKFTEQGSVTLRLSTDENPATGSFLRLEVQDTGIGIPADRLEAIFGEYEQVSTNTKQRFGGTGLGLSITRMLLALQGGSIHVASELGKGTTFSVRLPYRIGNAEEIEVVQETRAPQVSIEPGLRILVADDEAYNRLLLTTILKQWDATWVEVSNGEAALQAFQQADFDILILDMKMPILSGMDVAAAVRADANPEKAATPIIALTAGLNAVEHAQCIELGIEHILSKPFLAPSLAAAINTSRGVTDSEQLHVMPVLDEPEIPALKTRHGDLRQLVQLAHGNLEFVDELIQTYVRSMRQALPELSAALDAQDWIAIGDLCHKLAPPTSHLEAKQLHGLMKELERSCKKTPEPKQIRELVHMLQREADAVLEELEHTRVGMKG